MAIYYLDNPYQGPATFSFTYTSTGGINGGGVAIIGLAGTVAGVGNTAKNSYSSPSAASTPSTSIATSADNSWVIAGIANSGANNGAGTPAVVSPLTLIQNGVYGSSQWLGFASGRQSVPTSGTTITPTFNTAAGGNIHVIAAEFKAPDTTLPTLADNAVVDNKSGGPVAVGALVTYTVTFSEDMDGTTVDATDFGNAGTASVTIGTVTETSPGVFSVQATPTTGGTLQLKVNAGAVLNDVAGNALNTSSAIPDNTTLTVDNTPPTLTGSAIVDDKAGGPINKNTFVTYTVTFSEDMDASTVTAADFGNAGDASVTIGTVTETSPGVFSVPATPTTGGNLQLQIIAGAVLKDFVGNDLDTTSAIADDTTITVSSTDSTPPTLAPSAIVDNKSGGLIPAGTLVTYTVTFSEDMDDTTVDATDFSNAGTASISIGTVTETTPFSGVFTVPVTPTSGGTLQFQVNAGAELKDLAGNALDTTSAIADNTTLTVDGTLPTLASSDVVDNQGGGPVYAGALVTYTVTFSEDMDASTVSAADFGNAGTATISFGTVTETSSGVFTVPVTLTGGGTLQLQVNAGAVLRDVAGNALNTTSAIADDTTLTVTLLNLTWDMDAGTAGPNDGAGAWLDANRWWNGSVNQNWLAWNDAVFGNNGAGGAVTLASPTTVRSLTLNTFITTGYTLGTAGQTLTLNAGITKNAGGVAATIISPITLGGAQTWLNNSAGLITVGTDPVDNGGNLLTVDGSGNITISGAIGGSGGIAKNGAGTLALSGLNTYSGTTTISQGTLQLGNAGTSGQLNPAGSIVINGTLAFNRTDTVTQGTHFGAITSGTGGITKSGAGTLTLSGANAYSGGTVLNGGTVVIGADSNLGAANTAITVNGNSRINVTGNVTYTHPIAISSSVVLSLQNPNANTATFSGAITGAGGITAVSGSNGNTIALSSPNNTFTGNLSLPPSGNANDFVGFASIGDGGLISIGKGGWRGVAIYNGSANLVLNTRQLALNSSFGGTVDGMGNPITALQSSGAGTITFNADMSVAAGRTGTFYFDGSNTGGNTFAGIIPNSAGGTLSIGKWGAGKWVLSGANTYTGVTTISGGTLSISSIDVVANANPLGKSSSAAANLQLADGTTLQYTGATATTDRLFTLNTAANSGTVTLDASGTGPITFSNIGSVAYGTAAAGKTRTLALRGTNIGINTLAAAIGDNGVSTVALTKSGVGAWALSGANTYTGTTTIQAGSLVAGISDGTGTGAFGNAVTAIVLGNGSTLAGDAPSILINGPFTVGRAVTVGSVAANGVAYVATMGGSHTSGTATYAGNIALNLTANSYTVTLRAATGGTVEFKTGTWTTNNKAITIGASGNTGTVKISNALSTTGAVNVDFGTLMVNGALSGSGAVTVKNGSTLSGTGSITGPITVQSGGTLAPGGDSIGTLNLANTLTLNADGTVAARINKSGATLTADTVNMTAASGSIAYLGTLTVTATGDTLLAGDTFTLFAKGASGSLTGSFTALNLPALSGGLEWDTSSLTGDGSIRVMAAGAVVAPAFSPSAGAYVGAQNVTISCATEGATIRYTTDGSDPTPSSPVYSDAIPVPVDATMTIKAYATKDGLTDSEIASATYVTASTATWTNVNGGSWPIAGNWLNALIGQGSGVPVLFNTLMLGGNVVVTLDGARTVGSLAFGDGGNQYSWTLSPGTGGSITLNDVTPGISVDNGTATITAAVDGTQGLTKSGAGTLTLSGLNTYSGTTTINQGTLQLGNAGTSGQLNPAGGIVINGTLGFNRSDAVTQGTHFGAITSGTGGITKSGTGTLTLSGANAYSGGTVLNGGTLALSSATSLGTGNLSVAGSSRINATGGAGVGLTYAIPINVGAALQMQNPQSTTGATATFSGQLTGSSNISIVNGGGNGILAGIAFTHANNTFTGSIIMPAGSVAGDDRFSFNSIGDGGTFTFNKAGHQNAIIYTGSANIIFQTRRITIGTSFGYASGFDGGGVTPINRFMNNGSGTVRFNSNLTLTTTATSSYFFFDGSNSGDNTFAGIISNPSGATLLGIGKNGTGRWILTGANGFDGEVVITTGTLSVNSVAAASTSDQPLGNNTVVQLGHQSNSGTLEYTGGAGSTDKQVRIGNTTAAQTGAGSILNNGTGSLTFSSATFNPTISGITATRTLTLGGAYTGSANEIQGIIQNNNGTTGKINLTKTGSSTWTLSGVNAYTGPTTVSAGKLLVNGSLAGASTVTVTGGTLGGTGTVNGSVNVQTGGTLAPGVSTGTLTAGNVTIASGGILAIGIDAAQTPNGDKLAVGGALNIAGATLNLTFTGRLTQFPYVIATCGVRTGTFGVVNGLPAGYAVDYSYNSGTAIAIVAPPTIFIVK